jgi:hypothetical protein
VKHVRASVDLDGRLLQNELVQADAASWVVKFCEILIIEALGSIVGEEFFYFADSFCLLILRSPG